MKRPAKVAVWIFSILIGLVILGVAPYLMEVAFRLVAGWTFHGSKVLPKVTVDWNSVAMMALCVLLSGYIGHRFCGWLWKSNGRPEPWRLRWTASGLALIILLFAAGMSFTAVAHQTGWLMRSREPFLTSDMSNERNAWSSLKTIASAQADFRANDRDWNQINDYWRADIAGLYTTKGADNQPIKLIELSIAAADDKPASSDLSRFAERSPKAGYWYRALRYADEAKEVQPTSRFAACAYPSSIGAGYNMFLITEENIIFQKPFEGTVPEVCPDEPLKDGWRKPD